MYDSLTPWPSFCASTRNSGPNDTNSTSRVFIGNLRVVNVGKNSVAELRFLQPLQKSSHTIPGLSHVVLLRMRKAHQRDMNLRAQICSVVCCSECNAAIQRSAIR